MAKLGPKPKKGTPEYTQWYSRLGKLGGDSTTAKHGRTHFSIIGLRGGETIKRTLGNEHYSKIGKIGSKKQRGDKS